MKIRIARTFYKMLINFKRSENTFMIIMAVLIGLITGYVAIFFRKLISFFQNIFFNSRDVSHEYIYGLPWYLILIIPAVGGLLAGLIAHYYAKESKGQGVTEVLEAVINKSGYIRPRVILAKILTAGLTIGSGGSAGREGPIVQIGSASASAIGQIFRVKGSYLRIFVACGAAAGISATFNAPIAGAIFALEIIMGDFAISKFSPIVISAVTATVLSRYYLGDYPAFEVPDFELVSVYEFIPYVILGFLAAFTAQGLIKSMIKTEDIFNSFSSLPEWSKPAIGGLLVGSIALFFPHIMGVGYETMNMMLEGQLTWYFLLFLVFLKILTTSFTLSSGGSGGIFAPSLFLGAGIGGAVGIIANLIMPEYAGSPGAYALVGMGAVVAAVMNAPLTNILMLFEITNKYEIILPLMVTCIISVVIKLQINRESIYSLKLLRKGIRIKDKFDHNILSELKISEFLQTNYVSVFPDTPYSELYRLALVSHHLNYFVTDEQGRLKGILSPYQIRSIGKDTNGINEKLTASDLILDKKIFFTIDDSIDLVISILDDTVLDEIPIVNNISERKLMGYISKTMVISAYNKALMKKDMINSVSSYMSHSETYNTIKLPGGKIMMEMEVPGKFVGKSIGDINIRQVYGVGIILIKQYFDVESNEPEKITTPYPEYIFGYSDIILLIGTEEDINSFIASF